MYHELASSNNKNQTPRGFPSRDSSDPQHGDREETEIKYRKTERKKATKVSAILQKFYFTEIET